MSTSIEFVLLRPDEYDRAKTVLNRARHPGFVGRELFYRCATTGQCLVARVDEADAAVALITKGKLQALSVDAKMQGRGIGQALMRHAQPTWVQAIEDRVGWFERLGYVRVGAPRIGANGKHSTQLMQLSGVTDAAEVEIREAAIKPMPAPSEAGGLGGIDEVDTDDPRTLSALSLRYLTGVMRRELGERQLSVGVSAASKVLDHAHWLHEHSIDANLIAYLGGPIKAARWLADNRERLELLLASGDPMGLLASPSPLGDTSELVLESGFSNPGVSSEKSRGQ